MIDHPPTHAIIQQLCSLGISAADEFDLYCSRVRDREDISAWRCRRSGAVVLSTLEHMTLAHYEGKENFVFGERETRREAVVHSVEDSVRRAAALRPLILNRRWLDVGTGHGGILDLLSPYARQTTAVEPQRKAREDLQRAGHDVRANLDQVAGSKFDVVSLYHVFEHVVDPLGFMGQLKSLVTAGGWLVVEVPHAQDALLSIFCLPEFREFTLWSEHLLLHTRTTLHRYFEAAGMPKVCIEAIQRYPLANHLHWLARKKPGGHIHFNCLRTPELDVAYERMLARLDMTDTLYAAAKVND